MPELCRFQGIVILVRLDDHNWPHVHIRYAEHKASLRLADLEIVEGKLPNRQRKLVLQWARLRRAELLAAWARVERHEPAGRIDPL